MDIIEYYYNILYESVINDMGYDDLIYSSGVDHISESGKLSGFKRWRLRERSSADWIPSKKKMIKDQYPNERSDVDAKGSGGKGN
ncbi:hypothetical protein ACET3Z_018664 [Daucus carota]